MTFLGLSCIAGYENLAVWADLLDRINIFPVADGDTGTNLRISLAPLRDCNTDMAAAITRLSRSASGNSGNIASVFFREFLQAHGMVDLARQAEIGRDQAWAAIAAPCAGTMLGLFDALCLAFQTAASEELNFFSIRRQLQEAVLATSHQLPDLQRAGVVDSGALGMFIFFDAFLQQLIGEQQYGGPSSILGATSTGAFRPGACPVSDLFAGKLQVSPAFVGQATADYCVEAVLLARRQQPDVMAQIGRLGDSAVVVPDRSRIKVHIHTPDPERLRQDLSSLGEVVHWSDEAMGPMVEGGRKGGASGKAIRIMSDAAGSLPREMARQHGITLLDSYIMAEDQARPESLFSPEQLYPLMTNGVRVTTAQASTHERHLHYQAVCQQFDRVLYLCVGSAFTGNYGTAQAWKRENDPEDRFLVLDTGAASGRLAVIALLTARRAGEEAPAPEVIALARSLTEDAQEYIFLHELKYLVAGGRVSRTKGFFADLLHMKPVISPTREGVRKVGVVKNRREQLAFALDRLATHARKDRSLFILLQYSDNREWLQEIVAEQVRSAMPEAEIQLVPLSLTSGVHMGPGTWAMAFAEKEGGC
ncbi:MAG: DegV family EDD domain-containing protein [Proteobacteria bacterium]|nr:DegV family EDD domain-containing protein [Pseudomonadota bacterium]MBU1059156.1 DegV family EDD domain-containing protein [Pseudomonadota bacterium]